MSALARVLTVSVLSVCLFHSVPGAVAVDPPISGCGTKPADIVFLLDTSTSVGVKNFDKVKEFVKQYVTSFKIGPMDVNIGVVTFASEARNAFWLNTYTSERSLLEAIENMQYTKASTYTHLVHEAVRDQAFTKAHGDRNGIANILIVVADEKSYNRAFTAEEANRLHDNDISVIAIGVGDGNDKELNKIADNEESVFHVKNFDSLETIQDRLKISTCGAIDTTPPSKISAIDTTPPSKISETPDTTPEPNTTNPIEPPDTTPENNITYATETPDTTPEPNTTNPIETPTTPTPDTTINSTEPTDTTPAINITYATEQPDTTPENNTTNATGCGTQPADIVFLLDTSYTIRATHFRKVKEFVKRYVRSFNIGPMDVNVGVVTFASEARNAFWLNTYTSESSLLEAIENITYIRGATLTHLGLDFVRDQAFTKAHGDRDGIANILIVVTDGESNNSTLTAEEANKLHDTDISVIAVGVGDAEDEELNKIADNEESVFHVKNFDSLESIQDRLKNSTCGASGTTPPFNISGCNATQADIVFLLDASGSVGTADFKKVKDFVKDLSKAFKIGTEEVRISVVTFASTAHDHFWLSNYTSESSLLEAIDMISFSGGTTNTHDGLSHVRQHSFTEAQGDRDNVTNILIVVTDGKSDNESATSNEALELHKTDLTVLVIGVGGQVNESELEVIANGTDNVFNVADFAALDTLQNVLQKTACEAIAVAPPFETGDAHCLYKGKQYSQGIQWFDGCSQQCECQDAAAGRYQCNDWCPTYYHMPPQCYLAPVHGVCCLQPWCNFNMFYYVYTSQLVDKVNGQSACVYDGVKYFQSQTWAVGCDRFCSCNNAAIGLSVCQSVCVQYDALPPNCWLYQLPHECCPRPVCTFFTLKGVMTGMAYPSRYRGTVYSVFPLQ